MTITLSLKAEKQLRKLSKFHQLIIAKKIRALRDTSAEIGGEEKLSGYDNCFRVRVGDFRIVYQRSKGTIFIVVLGHRKEVYDILARYS